jgi:hypothetical protein
LDFCSPALSFGGNVPDARKACRSGPIVLIRHLDKKI